MQVLGIFPIVHGIDCCWQSILAGMRLFVGIGVPTQVGERLAGAASGLPPRGTSNSTRIRWTASGDMHVTLSFLGQTDPARLDGIQQSLAMLRAGRLHLELSGIGVFAGILHAKVKPSAALLAFAERVFRSMESCGFPREQRPFLPHVTLARTKGRISLQSSRGGDSAFWQDFEADEFRLYQSLTGPEGSSYKVLKAFPLR
jgi:RNA 2',3'-cyclic 3'-phosphodiesterase